MKKNIHKRFPFGLLSSVIFLLSSSIVNAQELKSFTLKGDVSQVKNPIKQIVLFYNSGNKFKRDSCVVINGKYQFAGEIQEPQEVSMLAIGLTRDDLRRVTIYIEPSRMTAVSDTAFENIQMTGAESYRYYLDWKHYLAVISHQIDSLIDLRLPYQKAYHKTKDPKDSIAMWSFQHQIDHLLIEQVKMNIAYAKAHLNSPVIVNVVESINEPEFEKEQEELFYQMPEDKQKSQIGIEMKARFDAGIGHMGTDFSIPDTAGNQVSLSSFRGRYVLLEFWASWCGPCRGEAPFLKQAFIHYKDKGFTIFSVSQDNLMAKKDWLTAIQKDGTGLWTQTSLLEGSDNAMAKAWGITFIPANFLLDPQGKIIAKNLRGEDLEKKLKELLN